MTPVAIFLHSGDYDRMHQGLSIAATAAATGRTVHIFFFWWALERLGSGRLDEPDFGPSREAYELRFENRGMPSLRALLAHIKESGLCTLHACTGSMAVVAPQLSGIQPFIDCYSGWSSILNLTSGVTDRFYL